MPQDQIQTAAQRSPTQHRGNAEGLSADERARWIDRPARSYRLPPEQPLSVYLLLSCLLFATSVGVALLVPPKEELPPMIEVDLGIDAVENEPPPLGEPDAGVGEVQPEPPVEEPVEPEPEPEPPEPEPEPEPMPEEEPPAPEPEPEFTVPEEKPVAVATPKPKPRTVSKPAEAPKAERREVRRPVASRAPAGSGATSGREGVRGSPTGTAGGRGGGRGDFVSTPHPQYDSTARQRRYEGRGMFLIVYNSGRITSVSVQQSTGVPYLDSRTIAWIKSRWRVKSGVSGSGRLPITWRLR